MPNELALTSATSTLSTLPPRRSPEYKAWLVIEIGNLAVYLRQQQQLDAAGYIQAQMAEDLADTTPAAMQETFRRIRTRAKFLPVTSEILDVYEEVQRDRIAAERAEERRKQNAENAAMLADQKEHPEKYFSVDKLIKERLAAARKPLHGAAGDPPTRSTADTSMKHRGSRSAAKRTKETK